MAMRELTDSFLLTTAQVSATPDRLILVSVFLHVGQWAAATGPTGTGRVRGIPRANPEVSSGGYRYAPDE
jgi:hypothetical protein